MKLFIYMNHHITTFYAMVKNNRIYTLNHGLSKIRQKQLITKIPTINAHTDYYLNEREEPPQHNMMKCIDDILKIKTDDKTQEIYLVPENKNLAELLFQLLNIGYEPRIQHTGIIDETRVKFNKITYIIQTQNLIKPCGDGWIAVSNETTYNNTNKAMLNFNKSLFMLSHKSFYNDIGSKILNETRTIVPSGLLLSNINFDSKTEVAENKAFTEGFLNISQVPAFNQFDRWKKHNDATKIDELHELTLYYVETIYTNIRLFKTTMDSVKELIEKNHRAEQMIYSMAYSKGIDVATYTQFRKAHDSLLFLNPDE